MADAQDLDAALAQFNEGLDLQRTRDKARRATEAAERDKQAAAASLKKLQADPNASGEDRSAAEAAYREAAAAFTRLRSGKPVEEPAEPETETSPVDPDDAGDPVDRGDTTETDVQPADDAGGDQDDGSKPAE